MSVWQWARRLAVAAAAGATGLAGAADSVWIGAGGAEGQGQVFGLRGGCYVLTAAHVVAGQRTGVTLASIEGYRASARVRAADNDLDLALLEVDDARTVGAKVCDRPPPLTVIASADLPSQITRASGLWIDRVASPAGGLERIELQLSAIENEGRRLKLTAASMPFVGGGSRLPAAGDSGALVWLQPRSDVRKRYGADGQPLRKVPGARVLLGVYLGGGDRDAVAVAGERVRDFVLQALAPVAWRELVVEPASVTVSSVARGAFARNADRTLEIDDAALATLAIELDLGDVDTVVAGLAVRGVTGASAVPTGLRVASSMFRPAPGIAWTAERCERTPRPPRGVVPPWGAECRFGSPRVARGLRVEVVGDPTALRRMQLIVAP